MVLCNIFSSRHVTSTLPKERLPYVPLTSSIDKSQACCLTEQMRFHPKKSMISEKWILRLVDNIITAVCLFVVCITSEQLYN